MKYKQSHKEKINEIAKKGYQLRRADPEFMEKQRQRGRDYYYRKKAKQSQSAIENSL
jgi:hypothetical protein